MCLDANNCRQGCADESTGLTPLIGTAIPKTAYCPFGYNSRQALSNAQLGFHGERYIHATGAYALGNGYRAYSPALRRFLSGDSAAPFARGGINTYAAFAGDPINFVDPDGHERVPVKFITVKAALRFKDVLGKARRTQFANDNQLSILPVLKSTTPISPKFDIASLKRNPDVGPAHFSIINRPDDLNRVGRRAQKFIFTSKGELIIGLDSKPVGFSHPVLKHLAKGRPHVISAGLISRIEDQYVITNHTGHYHESAQGLDTLSPVIAYLSHLGVKNIRSK